MPSHSKDETAAWMQAKALPAVHLTPASRPCFAKLGGMPFLPPGTEWPEWQGKLLSFLAQIDLRELSIIAILPGFPSTGKLFFFYDQDQSTWGFDPKDLGSWKVLYFEEESAEMAAGPTAGGMLPEAQFEEKFLSLHRIASLPGYRGRFTDDCSGLSEEDCDELDAMRSDCFQSQPKHQLGGYPDAVQNDTMELECELVSNGIYCGDPSGYRDPRVPPLRNGAQDWTLLFQIDTDDAAGMMWGDVGTLYFWIRRSDLVRKDFSMVWMILQCG